VKSRLDVWSDLDRCCLVVMCLRLGRDQLTLGRYEMAVASPVFPPFSFGRLAAYGGLCKETSQVGINS